NIATFAQLTAMVPPAGGRGPAPPVNGPTFTAPKIVAPPACPAVPSVTAGSALTTAIFQGEKRDGAQIFYAAGANTKQDSFALNAGKKLSLHIGVRTEPGHGANVLGIVEGGGPVL